MTVEPSPLTLLEVLLVDQYLMDVLGHQATSLLFVLIGGLVHCHHPFHHLFLLIVILVGFLSLE